MQAVSERFQDTCFYMPCVLHVGCMQGKKKGSFNRILVPQLGFHVASPRWLKEKTFSTSLRNFSHGKDDGLTGCSTTVVRLRGSGSERKTGKTILIGNQKRHLRYLASHHNPTIPRHIFVLSRTSFTFSD